MPADKSLINRRLSSASGPVQPPPVQETARQRRAVRL